MRAILEMVAAGQRMDVLFLHILANDKKEVKVGFQSKDIRGSPTLVESLKGHTL